MEQEGPPEFEDYVRDYVEKVAADPFFAYKEEPGFLDSLRIIVAAFFLGTNADRLARFLGLNRDDFVRPRAKLLRESGIFTQGTVGMPGKVVLDAEVADDPDDSQGFISIWLILASLVAEGIVVRTSGPDSLWKSAEAPEPSDEEKLAEIHRLMDEMASMSHTRPPRDQLNEIGFLRDQLEFTFAKGDLVRCTMSLHHVRRIYRIASEPNREGCVRLGSPELKSQPLFSTDWLVPITI